MAKIKPEKASEKITVTEFGGIRRTSALTGGCASDMRNFRISSDGSLEKRTGTMALYNLGQPIRGLWQGSIGNDDFLIVVAGTGVYIKWSGQSTLALRKRLETSSGNVSFFIYRKVLYMIDGDEVYRFASNSKIFIKSAGYSPLYGDNWDPLQMGEVNEPINTLSQKIRIRYDNSIGSTVFNLPFAPEQLGRVTVDGFSITPNPYVEGSTSFSIPQQYAHGTLIVSLTLSDAQVHREKTAAFTESLLFADANRSTVLLYGGSEGQMLAYSAPVSEEMLAESKSFHGTSEEGIYFPVENMFSLADPAHPIHAIFRDRNRAVALNDRFAWALEFSGDRLVSYPLEGGVGCASPGGWTLCGDRPVTIHTGGIFRLRFPSGESDVCIPESISQEIIELLPASIFQNGILAWFPGRGELWMRDPTETDEGLVWVYKPERKEWYCFDNLYITKFFEMEGTIGFGTADGTILLPDETSYTDNGEPVTAIYRSQYLAFALPENFKRAIRTTVCADTGGQQLTMLTETDSRSYSCLVTGNAGKPQFFEYSTNIGRFRFARFVLRIAGSSAARIYRLSMLANP